MDKARVVLYLNQFYAGVGGEEKANIQPQIKEGQSGPGKLLSSSLGSRGKLVGVVFCGDNYINEKSEAVDQVIELIKKFDPDVVIAGPAFVSGRYGVGCGAICDAVQERLKILAVTGMDSDNPGVDQYRTKVYIVPTGKRPTAMAEAMSAMSQIALKLAFREVLGSPEEEGYLPQGYKRNYLSDKTGGQRAVEMLLKRLRGEHFATERPLPRYEYIPPAPPVLALQKVTVALVTEGGCVPRGNPDKIEPARATKWKKYYIGDLSSLERGEYECVHGGFDTTWINQDPNRLVPLDVMRNMEREGVIGKLCDYLYMTVGNMGAISTISEFGKEIADDLKSNKVKAVILTAT